jgi:hypothetical protein
VKQKDHYYFESLKDCVFFLNNGVIKNGEKLSKTSQRNHHEILDLEEPDMAERIINKEIKSKERKKETKNERMNDRITQQKCQIFL